MGDTRYKPRRAGIRALMRGPEMQALMGHEAERVAQRAHFLSHDWEATYKARVKVGSVSAHGYAATGNYAAAVDEQRHDTLNRAL